MGGGGGGWVGGGGGGSKVFAQQASSSGEAECCSIAAGPMVTQPTHTLRSVVGILVFDSCSGGAVANNHLIRVRSADLQVCSGMHYHSATTNA